MNYIDDLAGDIVEEMDGHRMIEDADRPLYRLYAVLCLAKGGGVTNEDVHNAWSAWIVGRADFDPSRPPGRYRELSPEMQRRDDPFRAAINAVAERRLAEGD